jgi:predicted membrane-bound spermidine synthase
MRTTDVTMGTADAPQRSLFLSGVFFITFSVLLFQVVQTRILSVIAWYYLAFFAISVAMLGMTAGAVWVYLNRAKLTQDRLSTLLANGALYTALTMPASVMVQFCLITTHSPSLTSLVSWTFLMGAMTVPYLFAGVTVSLALTRSPFPVNQVYGVDLLGAAAGCVAVVGVLNVLDGPSAILLGGATSALAAWLFARGATAPERAAFSARPWWGRPLTSLLVLALLVPLNAKLPFGLRPVMVKNAVEGYSPSRFERWNSYSRIIANAPDDTVPVLWGPSPLLDQTRRFRAAGLSIDGAAGTQMQHFDGTRASIDFFRYDLVNLAYHLPGIRKSAVIGVGGGRDLMAAHLFGVEDITGVELNRIFVDLHTEHPFYRKFSNLTSIPNLKLHVDDARSWFSATHEQFDLIQMSMIDTWAATGAGAFSLSENGLYTLEGWRAFVNRLTDKGILTVSRWYDPDHVNESGRMVALALGTMFDQGASEPRRHIFVANAENIATLVLTKAPLTPEQLALLRAQTQKLAFKVLIDPDVAPSTPELAAMVKATNPAELDRVASTQALDLTVPTDNRPFFFNQLPFSKIPAMVLSGAFGRTLQGVGTGVIRGNLTASAALLLILFISMVGVLATIIIPLRRSAGSAPRALVRAGTLYFSLIGLGFMFAEISLLQYFSVFLGHPIYAMGVCLFSLILASGLGSLVSSRFPLDSVARVAVWACAVGTYLLATQWGLTRLFELTTAEALPTRIVISLAVVMPVGFLMGFAFPAGMMLVERLSGEPTPWFWGINGATGVLASVLAVMVSMTFGINVTMALAGVCYFGLIPAARTLLALYEAPQPADPTAAEASEPAAAGEVSGLWREG